MSAVYLEPQYSRYDVEHWEHCPVCDRQMRPTDRVTRHGDQVHTYCADLYCAEGDCEGHEDE